MRWEYRTDVVRIENETGIDPATGLPGGEPAATFDQRVHDRLAAAGVDGWELVTSQILAYPASRWVFVFKRPTA